jgi:hypothetical protein
MCNRKRWKVTRAVPSVLAALGLLSGAPADARNDGVQPAPQQQKDAPPQKDSAAKSNGQQSDTVTIHIEVTGGEKDKPIDGASVYVRFTEPRKLRSDRKVEMDVKTTPQGKARVPYVPRGKVIIQVVAEGWKTFGKTFDITEDEQVIKIHLDKPHQWY